MGVGGLETAGVNLQAKGFRQYLKNLNQIEKQQRDTFDREFIGLEKSYGKIVRAAKDYERQLKRTKQAQDKLARANQLNRSFAQLESRQRRIGGGLGLPGGLGGGLAAAGAVGGAIALAKAIKDTSRESAEAAATFNAQLTGINNLAASYGQSGAAIRAAMREASQGVLSESAIIQSANQALLLGVAKTPEQFSEVTRTALILGRTMGLTATQAIEQFNTALGRKSLLILDNFGISSKAVRAEIEKLAQAEFGTPAEALSEAQRDALFLEAALKIAGEAADAIGDEAIAAAGDFDRLAASAEILKIAFGETTLPLETALARVRTGLNQTLAQLLTIQSSVIQGGGIGDFFTLLGRSTEQLPDFKEILDPGAFDDFFDFLNKPIDETAPDLFKGVEERFKELSEATFGVSFDPFEEGTAQIEENSEAIEENTQLLNGLNSVLQQAERLQLSFARATEDAARQQGRQSAKLARTQEKEREKLLDKQIKDLDDFEKDRIKDLASFEKDRSKQIANAEKAIENARDQVAKDRLAAQKALQQKLRQNEDRFRLSQLQSERRFQLSDRRLRAEGDILALQELRENRDLETQEAQENFGLQQRQTKESEKEISDDRIKEAQTRLEELKNNLNEERKELEISLEEQRAELLAGFDTQLQEQQIAQEEQRTEQQRAFAEQAEDRLINQQRQLEDLGRSLADQKDLTSVGAKAIAGELEKVFGIDGAADIIFEGFSDRTKSEFEDLLDEVEDIVKKFPVSPIPGGGVATGTSLSVLGASSGVPSFQEGGVVPGPIGSPQLVQAHGGETILPTHQQTQTIAAPVIPSQNINVSMSGGFNITGGEQAGTASVQAAVDEMTESFEVAVRRIVRRG